MNKGIIYCTKIREEYEGAHMEHMIAEKLLEIALKKEYGINLYNEPRAEGEQWKTILSYRPSCIIISVIPEICGMYSG